MPFLSVIIPVYNVEPYIRQCVDSVLNQKLDDYELILVDDGSSDSCPEICDRYAQDNPDVRVIHKENGGASSARNAGLCLATGEYVVFIDSDDWWNPNVNVRKMLVAVKANPNADLFLFSGLDYVDGEGYYERTDSVRRLEGECYNAEDYYKTMLASGNLQVHAATKILKTDFLLENKLEFQNGIKGEDNEWMIRVLRCNPIIMILPDLLYIYRVGRSDSVTNTIEEENIRDLLQIVDDSLKYYESPDVDRHVMDLEYGFCAYLWFCALGLSQKVSVEGWRELIQQFRCTASVCSYSHSPKTKLAYSLYQLAGLGVTAHIMGIYIKLKSRFRYGRRKIS